MLFDDPNKLSNDEIRERLAEIHVRSELIDSIVEQFWFNDWGNSFISFPEHLEVLIKYLESTDNKSFCRYDYYSYLYQNVVPNYERVADSLRKVGMVFEIMQTDKIAFEELVQLLDELKAPEKLTLESLYKSNLVTFSENDGIRVVQWVHHTLTEFLGAEYILTQKDVIGTVNKFLSASEDGTISFVSSWTGVLRFLLEKTPEAFIDWIKKCCKTNHEFINDQIADTLVFATPADIEKKVKKQVFSAVYDLYQEKKWWIPTWAYHNLYKFIDEDSYQNLKNAAGSDSFVHRGNIAATVDGMLLHSHPLIKKDKEGFWKNKLIGYANDLNKNGVLQRHAMAALENYKGETDVIDEVKTKVKNSDSLIRDAYISMLMMVDPNYSKSIKAFVDAIADNVGHVYARNALYKIDTKESITLFLKLISKNHDFIHEFIDDDSIYNKGNRKADDVLLKNIEKNLTFETSVLLQKILINGFAGNENYHAGDSYFLQQIARIIQKQEPNFLKDLIGLIGHLQPEQKSRIFINDIEGIIAVLLKADEIEEYKELFTEKFHHHAPFTFAEAIRKAESVGNPEGKEILKKGIELGITIDPSTAPKFDDAKKERESKIYKEFHKYLFPEKEGTYFTNVFSFFIENQKIIEEQWDSKDEERLLFLAIDVNLEKFDPEKIQVRYKDQETKSGKYTISSVAGYFADVLRVVSKLRPDLLKKSEIRRKIINFIPFVYLSDFKVIQAIISDVSDEEITQLNKVMMDKTSDTRYLVPQTYIYFANAYPKLKTTKTVLFSLIQDTLIREDDRVEAIKVLKNQLSPTSQTDKDIFTALWNPDIRSSLSDSANEILISVFKDKKAIDWRIQKIIDGAAPFHRQEGVHSVGDLEMEIDYKHFARPIIELGDEKYLEEIKGLLNFSLTLTQNEYLAYQEYLQQIAIAYVVRDDFFLSTSAYTELKHWAKKHKTAKDINWFEKRLESAFSRVKTFLNKKNKISDAVALL